MFIKVFIDKDSIKVYKLRECLTPNKMSFHKSSTQSPMDVPAALPLSGRAPTPLLVICSSLLEEPLVALKVLQETGSTPASIAISTWLFPLRAPVLIWNYAGYS